MAADQVRFYNVALTQANVTNLFQETASATFRFPLMMTKGQQTELLGNGVMPDGQMAGQSPVTIQEILEAARDSSARITIRVTPPNQDLTISSTNHRLSVAKWKTAFNTMAGINADSFVAIGTLIGLMAIDEPFSDFDFVTGSQLDSLCQHQKSKPTWNQVPCFVRDINTRLYTERPGGNPYQFVDAGWAQIADHHYVPASKYDGDMGAYFRDNLAKGDQISLGLMYGFNLIGGGREDLPGCIMLDGTSTHNCADAGL